MAYKHPIYPVGIFFLVGSVNLMLNSKINNTMKLVRYNPVLRNFTPNTFSGMIDRFFEDSFNLNRDVANDFVPRVDVSETEKEFRIAFAVPGMNKKDFKIDYNEGQLTISGERKIENQENGRNFHSIETQYGSFSRTFYLPEIVDHNKINASYKDGILDVVIPKDEKKALKASIEVK